jgi:Domain of unknown function (DUF4145)
MKCPHCNTGIAEAWALVIAANYPQAATTAGNMPAFRWDIYHQRCPECLDVIIKLVRVQMTGVTPLSFMVYPTSRSRPIPTEVVEPYRQDFVEACKVLQDSPKASAALSRRNLQAILRDKAGTKSKDLFDQIEEVIKAGKVPSYISEGLHGVRVIGNFAAHPLKGTNTGEIIEVEDNEAEWNLEILERLFDFYFVQPTIAAKRKEEINKKLKEAGKPEIP